MVTSPREPTGLRRMLEGMRNSESSSMRRGPLGTVCGSTLHLKQLKSKGLSKSRSEPCLGTEKRERKTQDEDSTSLDLFRTLFPLPAKGIDMRKDAARDEVFVCGTKVGLFKPRPETVALSATEKHEMRMWGLDMHAVTWPDGTKPPPWVKAVGNTTNKWANKELGIRAAREEQEFVEKLREVSPSRNEQPSIAHHTTDSSSPFSSASSTKSTLLPPWVKELPPVRDGRRQFATGKIIPFLDQHVYLEGGVAEAKRARRRERQAFLKTVLTANDVAAAHRAAQANNAPDASAGTISRRGMRWSAGTTEVSPSWHTPAKCYSRSSLHVLATAASERVFFRRNRAASARAARRSICCSWSNDCTNWRGRRVPRSSRAWSTSPRPTTRWAGNCCGACSDASACPPRCWRSSATSTTA